MTTTTPAAALVAAAETVTVAHAAALAPLTRIGRRTHAQPPAIDAALAAVAHLHAAQPQLDHAVGELYEELLMAGVRVPRLARALGVRKTTLDERLGTPAPAPVTKTEIAPGVFKLRDKISTRCARESLISAAAGVGTAYSVALRPMARLSQREVPEAATVDASIEAAVHLHRSRRSLADALDPVLAALVLGGVKRMALAEQLGCNPETLQRRLAAQPLASARWADLEDTGGGTWRVHRAAVGRYA